MSPMVDLEHFVRVHIPVGGFSGEGTATNILVESSKLFK